MKHKDFYYIKCYTKAVFENIIRVPQCIILPLAVTLDELIFIIR